MWLVLRGPRALVWRRPMRSSAQKATLRLLLRRTQQQMFLFYPPPSEAFLIWPRGTLILCMGLLTPRRCQSSVSSSAATHLRHIRTPRTHRWCSVTAAGWLCCGMYSRAAFLAGFQSTENMEGLLIVRPRRAVIGRTRYDRRNCATSSPRAVGPLGPHRFQKQQPQQQMRGSGRKLPARRSSPFLLWICALPPPTRTAPPC